jgi:uncharacterized protein YcaQ
MTVLLTIGKLRRQAVHLSLRAPTTLARAMEAQGFVQSDPMRSPARAQDLILRHRVAGYAIGDLERRYPELELEEDYLYAYGSMPRHALRLLHPRLDRNKSNGRYIPTDLAADILAFVRERGPTHPRSLEAQFGCKRAVNGWGGFSKASTRALQQLHYYGLLRVKRREHGIRVYEPAAADWEPLDPAHRLRRLVALTARILSPLPETTLRAVLARFAYVAPGLENRRTAIDDLLKGGELEAGSVDDVRYVWPAGIAGHQTTDVAREVRFLAPFDPLVWDRMRFEHIWGWSYRFEAYTPARQRRLGYYAMPLLWADRVIGWANCTVADGRLHVATGFVGRAPREKDFRRALDREIARMEEFLLERLHRSETRRRA